MVQDNVIFVYSIVCEVSNEIFDMKYCDRQMNCSWNRFEMTFSSWKKTLMRRRRMKVSKRWVEDCNSYSG